MFKVLIVGISLLSSVSFAGPRPGATVKRSYHCGSIANERGLIVKGVAYVIECQSRLKDIVSCAAFKKSIRPGTQKGAAIPLSVLGQDEEVALVANEEAKISSTIYKQDNSAEIILHASNLSGVCEAF